MVGAKGPDGVIIAASGSCLPGVSSADALPEPEPEAAEYVQASGGAVEHGDDGDRDQGDETATADEEWTSDSSDEEADGETDTDTDTAAEADAAETDNPTGRLAPVRLEPLAAMLAQAPEPWMRGASQADWQFLVIYPALSGAGAEDAAAHGGHEWVGRDQIYPLRAAADTSGAC